jgi:hypothetical protein
LFIRLSNEEKFALADAAACKFEKETGTKMTPQQYEEFVWGFINDLHKPKYE